MVKILFRWHRRKLIWFCIPILMIACHERESTLVNERYLRSKSYSTFEKSAIQERKQKERRAKTIEDGLQVLPQCNRPHFSLPFEISHQNIATLTKKGSCKALNGDLLKNLPLKFIGKSHFREADIYFVLIDNDILNTSRRLIVVTYRDNQLKDKKMIGMYKKSISEQITTNIRVGYDGEILKVNSKMIRNIEYPIKQQNTVVTQYEIDGRGDIRII